MAKFKAKTTAFYGNRRIRPGETFDAPKDFEAKWADPVEAPAAKKKVRKKASKKSANRAE